MDSTPKSLKWLYALQHLGVKLGLDSIRALLASLDHPETACPSVLVAGTNGKGSVSAMVHSVLCASGVLTGLYTSPHLVRPTERIRIGNREITEAELDRFLTEVRQRIEAALEDRTLAAHPSFFEVVTAVALEAFRAHGVAAAVLEVGLGGRLDATNAVDAEVSVVVNVDLDHMNTLGSTVALIAAEKAGIVKPGRPVVSGVVRQGAVTVLQRICRDRGSPLIDARATVRLVSERDGAFSLETAHSRYPDLRVSLAGRHQIDNARVALATLEAFMARTGRSLDPQAVREGLSSVRWPGRLQWVRRTGSSPDLLFDGAHNTAGMRTLAAYLRGLPRRPVALFGAMSGKPLSSMLAALGPCVEAAIVTRPAVLRSAEPEEIAAEARAWTRRVEVVLDPSRALARAEQLAGREHFVLVTGSLYLVGEILALLDPLPGPGPVAL